MKQRKRIKCLNCGSEIDISLFRKHKKPCDILYENKILICNDYESNLSLKKIGKKFQVDSRRVSVFLKSQGVKVKSENGQYKLPDNVNEEYFSQIDSPIKAWLVGLIAADGCIVDGGKGVRLSQSGDKGLKLIRYVKELLGCKNSIVQRKTDYQIAYSIGFNSKKTVSDLAKYNIVPRKSLVYSFPENLSDAYIRDFLRGYLEGDGSIGIYSNGKGCRSLCVSFVGTSKFIDYSKKLIPIEPSSHCVCYNSTVVELRWNGEKAIKFCEWLFATPGLYLSYKYEKYQEFLQMIKDNPPKYARFAPIKKQASELLKSGLNCLQIAKIIGLGFQTVYYWKKNKVI